MIFTVFCGSQLYIGANGGGTHVTSLEALQKLTKASLFTNASMTNLTGIVGRCKRSDLSHGDDDSQDLGWHLFRTHRGC